MDQAKRQARIYRRRIDSIFKRAACRRHPDWGHAQAMAEAAVTSACRGDWKDDLGVQRALQAVLILRLDHWSKDADAWDWR